MGIFTIISYYSKSIIEYVGMCAIFTLPIALHKEHWKATVIIATLDYIYYLNIQGTDEVTRGHAISSESAGSESREK